MRRGRGRGRCFRRPRTADGPAPGGEAVGNRPKRPDGTGAADHRVPGCSDVSCGIMTPSTLARG
ncbi:MAG: hypothetical protein AVDCRST_MAG57-296 [uncultured Blastococcus sp.]|uniref:Uncharacterized protein n=1 Tax=uncultured Blastococcus sp. TaxID=217144 RepID=A0A6J4H6U9_9ACTN|nr:MAG: hypothetical protein AVDCRST_MAG57-296 [uncultured Blastococcus sp.]